MRIALYTYSTKPRGGVAHTLALAEALRERGHAVTAHALGAPEEGGFFREAGVDTRIVPFPPRPDEPFEARIARYIEVYAQALEREPLERFDVHHAQDCISANALLRLREKGRISFFLRTVHHLDDFTTPALVDCQRRSIAAPDALVTVSRYWRERLRADPDCRREAEVVHNGVEARFFRRRADRERLKREHGLAGRTVFLTLGGIEPRKNTIRTLRAFAAVKRELPDALLLIAGGTTLFDYRYYLEQFREELRAMDDEVRGSVRLAGSPDNGTIERYYGLADCFVQPSVKEGWGLAVMEAMAVGTPVAASTIDVFREFLRHESNALLADPEDEAAIAACMLRIATEPGLGDRLAAAAGADVRAYGWETAAEKHEAIYERMTAHGIARAID